MLLLWSEVCWKEIDNDKVIVTASSVTLGYFLDLLLLFKGIRRLDVSFLNVDDFVSKDFSNTLLTSESVLSGTLGDKVDSSINSSEGGNIDSLFSNNTTGTNSGGIFSGTSLNDGSNEDLKRISSSKKMDDLEGVPHDSDGFNLFTSVSAVELKGSDQSLNDGAECFSEFSALVSTSSVGNEHLRFC
jgi:hypothetical protein